MKKKQRIAWQYGKLSQQTENSMNEILRYIGEIRRNAQQMAFRNYTDNK